jgi:hypothetical protein
LLGFQVRKQLRYSKRKRKLRENPWSGRSDFTLDFNALHRVGGGMEEVLSEMKAPSSWLITIKKPDDYAAYSYSTLDWIDLRNAL